MADLPRRRAAAALLLAALLGACGPVVTNVPLTVEGQTGDGPPAHMTITEHAGVVTKVTNFGVFVALDDDLEGLLHVSELTPADALEAGQPVAVRVLRLDTDERKIALTLLRGDAAKATLEGQDELLARLGGAADAAAAKSAAAEAAQLDDDGAAEASMDDAGEPAAEEVASTDEAPTADASADDAPADDESAEKAGEEQAGA